MKIGILTFFKSYNYGVWLQAYATQQFLITHGFDVEVVNYTNIKDDEKLQYFYKEGNRFRGYFFSFLKSLLFGKVRYYKKGFKKYLNIFYRLSKEHYTDPFKIKKGEYDILVAGSDQIWNPAITGNKLDKAFLLEFDDKAKKISYASSIGSKNIREEDKKEFENAFEDFSAISVREEFAAIQLQPLSSINIEVVCDPTFLLKKVEWRRFWTKYSALTLKEEKYILTYFVSLDKYTERYINLVKNYSSKLKLPVWSIQFSSYYQKNCDKKILGASIADFVNLIDNAALVITDSFHGVAMSLNMNTDFVALENRANPERVNNLLDNLLLKERIELKAENYFEIDYKVINLKINRMREHAAEWLLKEIGE